MSLPREEPGTSLHCRFAEEWFAHGVEAPEVESREIGPVDGSKPRATPRERSEPSTSLVTRDVEGAAPLCRVGSLPYSMYGPRGNRPARSSNLDLSDIEGAQADTLCRGPRTARGSRVAGAAVVGLSGTPRAAPGGP